MSHTLRDKTTSVKIIIIITFFLLLLLLLELLVMCLWGMRLMLFLTGWKAALAAEMVSLWICISVALFDFLSPVPVVVVAVEEGFMVDDDDDDDEEGS